MARVFWTNAMAMFRKPKAVTDCFSQLKLSLNVPALFWSICSIRTIIWNLTLIKWPKTISIGNSLTNSKTFSLDFIRICFLTSEKAKQFFGVYIQIKEAAKCLKSRGNYLEIVFQSPTAEAMGFCKRRILVIDYKITVLTRLSTVPFQKLISDDRFRSENEEDPESQLPVQFLATVASTPTLADEVQVEVMKVSQRFLIQVNSLRIFLYFSYLKLGELWDRYSPKFTMCKSFAVVVKCRLAAKCDPLRWIY